MCFTFDKKVMNQDEDSKAWVNIYDEYGDATGTIAGNKEGLEILKSKIDQAIQYGSAQGKPDLECDFLDVRVEVSKNKEEKTKESFINKIVGFGCLLLIITVMAVFLVGLSSIYDFLTTK